MASGQYNNNNLNNPNGSGRRPPNKRRGDKVPGAVIAIYIMMAVLVLAICALIFVITLSSTGWNGKNQPDLPPIDISGPDQSGAADHSNSVDPASTDSSDVSDDPDNSDSSDNSENWSVIYSSSGSGDSSWESSSSDVISFVEPPSSSDSDIVVKVLPMDYDEEFFKDDLFIGDSIFTGLYLYGYMDAGNVAAAVGYTPYKAIHSAFGTTYSGSAADYAAEMQPKRIIIMLGSNTMAAGTDYDVIIAQYKTLIQKLKTDCPDSVICVVSIPPVTKNSSSAASAKINNSDIDSVNVKLENMADSTGVAYLDLNKMLSDDDGYFMEEYAEMDGLHFKGVTYKVLLSALQKKLGKTGG